MLSILAQELMLLLQGDGGPFKDKSDSCLTESLSVPTVQLRSGTMIRYLGLEL